VTIRYLPLAGVLVTLQAIPLLSSARTVEVMSLVWRSVKLEPSGDDVLQRLDVRVVDRRVVDVAEHAVRDREPHLRRRVACGAEAVLARQVEVGQRARPVRGVAQRRGPGARGDRENDECHGGDCKTGQPPRWRQAAHARA
jgi:hypothetical protein